VDLNSTPLVAPGITYTFILTASVHGEGDPVGTKGVSQLYHFSFDDNKVLKIINWILLKVYSSVQDH